VEESVESVMNEIRAGLERLESILPSRVDPMAVSRTAKLPFKGLVYRAALIWRMAELGRIAFESFENDKLASAILLTRAAIETSAALWYLCAKLEKTVQSGKVGDIDEYLMKLMMGSKIDADMPSAINVLTFVDHVDKEIDGFRHQYDILSEFAHPNGAGTTGLYSKFDPSTRLTDFGPKVRDNDGLKLAGVFDLSVSLAMFEDTCSRILNLIAAFVVLCESQLKTAASDKD